MGPDHAGEDFGHRESSKVMRRKVASEGSILGGVSDGSMGNKLEEGRLAMWRSVFDLN